MSKLTKEEWKEIYYADAALTVILSVALVVLGAMSILRGVTR